jgi:hypothetical protein
MGRPDPGTREGRRLYRRELAGIARGWRYAGLGLVAVGIVKRSRYHRRRMAGRAEPERLAFVSHPTCFQGDE